MSFQTASKFGCQKSDSEKESLSDGRIGFEGRLSGDASSRQKMDDAAQRLAAGDEPLCHRVRGATCSIFVKQAVTQFVLQSHLL